MQIIHLSPHLPPAICGVTDYAALVGRAMEALSPEIRCAYLGCGWKSGPLPECESPWRDLRGKRSPAALWNAVEELASRSSDTEAGQAQGACVVLHYSGYGYDGSGAPDWLAGAVENRPPGLPAVRVVTVFHELYATGRPWHRAFWSSGRQRRVAERVARASDALMTNRAESARWLERTIGRPAGSVPSVPVASNVGEPAAATPWNERASQAVLFGGIRFKSGFLAGGGARTTAALCQNLEIDRLIDIGESAACDEKCFAYAGVRIERTGFLPAADVGPYFRSARLALVDYVPGYHAKSGVLAAAAAHGTPAIFLRPGVSSDGFRFGETAWDLTSAAAAPAAEARCRLAAMSDLIFAWYRPHALAAHAKLVAALASPATVPACWT